MPYIGNQAVVGDSANTFKLLDDIASFTVTFDATDSGVVSIANNTLTFNNHRFVTAQKVTYNDGGGTAIGGLSDGSYFIIKEDQNTIKLASSASNAASGTAIDLTSGAAGGSHTLKIAFDGINTKFKATHTNGTKAKISRAAQLSLSINGVIQQPQDTSSPTVGYGIEADSTIVFSTAPAATDKVFGSFIGEVAASFDLTDNTVDEFTANGSTTTFTLSKTVPSSNDILVTLDGVTQYPTTQSNTRAYSVLENVLTFVSAPSAGVIIQVRHIGFAGATSQSVTGFYGRTGNVQLKNTDNVAVNNLTVAGNLDVTGDITYDETVARNLNITGIATVASGIVSTGDFKIGTATTLSQDNIFTTGIITATNFVGGGANLTSLNASNLGSGTVPTARLGSGTASSSTFLRGDSTFATVTSTTINNNADNLVITGSGTANTLEAESGLTFASKVLDFQQGNNSTNTINGTVQFSNANHSVAKIEGTTRTTEDDGDLKFYTKNGGTFTEGLRISFHAEPKLQMLAGETEIVSSASDGSLIFSSDPGQNRSNSYIGFTIDASSVGRMDSNGLKLESGKGINFDPHSASNYNFLDDYEETSWTPIVYSGIDGGATYTIQRGWAVKIGHFVHFSFFIRFSGTGNGNQFKIGGLPYTSASSPYSAAYSSGGSLHYSNAHFNNSNPQQLFVVNNATYIDFYNNNSSNTSISGSGSSKDIYASGAYQAS